MINKEAKIKDLLTKIELLRPDLEFQIKYTAIKAGEHTTAKTHLEYYKEQIREYKERIKILEEEKE